MLVLIDGPAGVGKGTVARGLAKMIGYQALDTGLYYRAVVSMYLEYGGDPLFLANSLVPEDLERADLRSSRVNMLVPIFSDKPAIRLSVNRVLRRVTSHGQWILDGRAGAYEFPEADVKLFLDASPEVRAARRASQENQVQTVADIAAQLRKRDIQDMSRDISPLYFDPRRYHALIDSTHHRSAEETIHVTENMVHTILVNQLYQ